MVSAFCQPCLATGVLKTMQFFKISDAQERLSNFLCLLSGLILSWVVCSQMSLRACTASSPSSSQAPWTSGMVLETLPQTCSFLLLTCTMYLPKLMLPITLPFSL